MPRDKNINPSNLNQVVDDLQIQIDELLLRIKALEDRTYEEVENGTGE